MKIIRRDILFLMSKVCLISIFLIYVLFIGLSVTNAQEISPSSTPTPNEITISAAGSDIFTDFIDRITSQNIKEDISGYNRGALPYMLLEQSSQPVKDTDKKSQNDSFITSLAFEHGVSEAIKTPNTVVEASTSWTDMFKEILDAIFSIFTRGNSYAKGMMEVTLPFGLEPKAVNETSEMEKTVPLLKCADVPYGVNTGCDKSNTFGI